MMPEESLLDQADGQVIQPSGTKRNGYAVKTETSQLLADLLVQRLQGVLTQRTTPVFVALDGRGGCGKSTIATLVADQLNAGSNGDVIVTVIEGDQFFAGGSLASWDELSIADRVDRVIDWRREQALLQSLKETGSGEWHPFNWESGDWDSDKVPLKAVPERCIATPVVILEGVYSARPELADLFDVRVLVKVPAHVSEERLRRREGDAYLDEWERRWSEAERHYFSSVVPAEKFDIVLDLDCCFRSA